MKPERILVVEDDPDTRDLLMIRLNMEGYVATGAEDGRDGLNKISEEDPDLMITDLCMPKLAGVELIKLVRELEKYKKLPIVAISAFGSGESNEAREAGADIVLRKPLALDLLALVVKELLQ